MVRVSQKLLNELLSKSQEEAIAKATGTQSQSRLITVSFSNILWALISLTY